MNLSFLRFFKKDRTDDDGNVAVATPPPPLEKPASERLGKTVMPSTARVRGVEPAVLFEPAPSSLPALVPPPVPSAIAPAAPAPARRISLGNSGDVVAAPSPGMTGGERMISLPLADLGPHLPPGLLQTTPIDPDQHVAFKASELEKGMAHGRPTALVRSIYQQAPDYFIGTVGENDEREVPLPFGKVLEQFSAFQVRPDQLMEKTVPQMETPFLKVTLEDEKRHGTSGPTLAPGAVRNEPAPAAVAPPRPVTPPKPPQPVAPPDVTAPKTPRPIRLPLPNEARQSSDQAPPAASGGSSPAPLTTKKISPNGMGAPASEKVPASSGSPISTPLPSPLAPPPPARVPLKVSPPSNDLREIFQPSTAASVLKPAAPMAFSREGPRVHLSLRNLLRGISPFQLSFEGPVDEIPEAVMLEVPFSIIDSQLSLGRVSLSPAQFQAALPEEYRARVKIEDPHVPIALPLQEVLQNLPNESLQLRGDQEEIEVTESFETPFSTKAAEDATRMKVAAGPIHKADFKPAAAAPLVPAPAAEVAEPESPVKTDSKAEPTLRAAKVAPKLAPAAGVAAPGASAPVEPEVKPFPIAAAKAVPTPAAEATSPRPGAATPATIERATPATIERAAPATAEPATAVTAEPATRTALQDLFETDDALDAKAVVAHASRLPGVSACAIVFADGLSLAGNIPAEYQAEGLCAIAPAIVKRLEDQVDGTHLGQLDGVTLFCAKAPISFFAHGNICLAALHSAAEIGSEIRTRLAKTAQELSRIYAQPA